MVNGSRNDDNFSGVTLPRRLSSKRKHSAVAGNPLTTAAVITENSGMDFSILPK